MRGVWLARGGEEFAILVLEAPDTADLRMLSAHERQVVALVMEGLSSAEIARRRGTSPRTVANQLRSIYGKVGVTSRSELVVALAPGPVAR